jgi:hypothetical protein
MTLDALSSELNPEAMIPHSERQERILCSVLEERLIETTYLGSPEEPTFEDVIVSSTLDDFVSSIVCDIVVFVLLEQIVCTHCVAVQKQTL